MAFSFDHFSHIKDFHLQNPDKVRAKSTFSETVENVRRTWQTKPFVADANGRILTHQEEFAALEDLMHMHIGVVQWLGSEPIDLPAARSVVARILALRRKQADLEAAIDLLRLAEVNRKSLELDVARFHIAVNHNMR